MTRWLASLAIGALLLGVAWLPHTGMGRRGSEGELRADAPALGEPGGSLPELSFRDLEGRTVSLSEFAGRHVLLTFERSVDW